MPLTGGAFRDAAGSRVAWGIALGLLLGKPIGIVGFALAARALGIARFPPGIGWRHVTGLALLGGIGFTVSLFIASLAFGGDPELEAAKLAVLTVSVVAGTAGFLFLRFAAPQGDG